MTLPPPGPVYVVKPGIRWAQPPNQHNSSWGDVRSGREFFVNTDENGLRLPLVGTTYVPDDKERTTTVFLGDSIIFGWGIGDQETVPAQLAFELRKREPERLHQVINAGQPGYSSMQSYMLFKHVLTQFEPDTVVLQLAEHNLVPRSTPDSHSLSIGATAAWNLKLLEHCRLYRELHKHLVNWLDKRARRMASEDQASGNTPKDRETRNALARLLDKNTIEKKDIHEAADALAPQTRVPPEELREILEALAHLGQDLGFRLGVYFQGMSAPQGPLAPWTDVVNELEAQNKLVHLQIYNELEWVHQSGTYLYLPHDAGHYNPYGARLVAEMLANAITLNRLTREKPSNQPEQEIEEELPKEKGKGKGKGKGRKRNRAN